MLWFHKRQAFFQTFFLLPWNLSFRQIYKEDKCRTTLLKVEFGLPESCLVPEIHFLFGFASLISPTSTPLVLRGHCPSLLLHCRKEMHNSYGQFSDVRRGDRRE